MPRKIDLRNCPLCRFMRGMATGGLGAALFGVPAKLLGEPHANVVYWAFFGALLVTVWFNRKKKSDSD